MTDDLNLRIQRQALRIRELEIAAEQATAIAVEAAALVADNAASEAERTGQMHPENSDSRGRMFARAREATAIAERIRKLAPRSSAEPIPSTGSAVVDKYLDEEMGKK